MMKKPIFALFAMLALGLHADEYLVVTPSTLSHAYGLRFYRGLGEMGYVPKEVNANFPGKLMAKPSSLQGFTMVDVGLAPLPNGTNAFVAVIDVRTSQILRIVEATGMDVDPLWSDKLLSAANERRDQDPEGRIRIEFSDTTHLSPHNRELAFQLMQSLAENKKSIAVDRQHLEAVIQVQYLFQSSSLGSTVPMVGRVFATDLVVVFDNHPSAGVLIKAVESASGKRSFQGTAVDTPTVQAVADQLLSRKPSE
jgi:hypothetical protein